MTKEDKELLLKDLCARLPYYVMVNVKGYDTEKLIGIENETITTKATPTSYSDKGEYPIDIVKPYLRPMSSMTKEEREEMYNLLSPEGTAIYGNDGIALPLNHCGEFVPYEFMNRIIQYLLENHFDFMGLIPKGLAIEVTNKNNPYENGL